ncbi:hypothetical protein FACS1894208_06390 [Clostridia bacterium]|nr:hypothetical protein FACS1894208_06390 [Clostridia bacterium]
MKKRDFAFVVKQDLRHIARRAPEYAFILHNKDINPATGELKEAHFHYYVRYLNPRSLSGVAREFGIPNNMIEVVHSRKQTLSYLAHRTVKAVEEGNYQYDVADIESNIDYAFDAVSSAEAIDYFAVFNEADTLSALFSSLRAQGEQIENISKFRVAVGAFRDVKYLNGYYLFLNGEENRQQTPKIVNIRTGGK